MQKTINLKCLFIKRSTGIIYVHGVNVCANSGRDVCGHSGAPVLSIHVSHAIRFPGCNTTTPSNAFVQRTRHDDRCCFECFIIKLNSKLLSRTQSALKGSWNLETHGGEELRCHRVERYLKREKSSTSTISKTNRVENFSCILF